MAARARRDEEEREKETLRETHTLIARPRYQSVNQSTGHEAIHIHSERLRRLFYPSLSSPLLSSPLALTGLRTNDQTGHRKRKKEREKDYQSLALFHPSQCVTCERWAKVLSAPSVTCSPSLKCALAHLHTAFAVSTLDSCLFFSPLPPSLTLCVSLAVSTSLLPHLTLRMLRVASLFFLLLLLAVVDFSCSSERMF